MSIEAAMVATSPGASTVLAGLGGGTSQEEVTFLISSGPLPTFLIMKTSFRGGPLNAVPKLYSGSATWALGAPVADVPVCSPSSAEPPEGRSAALA